MGISKLIDRLRFGGEAQQMIVLTPEEAKSIYNHIDALETRLEVKQLKFLAVCESTYNMVQVNRDLRRKLDEINASK